jgi:hypothetical protein
MREYGLAAILVLLACGAGLAVAQDDIDREPICYKTAPVSDAVAQLQLRMEAGDVELAWDDRHGWLPSLLELLEVPRSSQTLVFSKTSLQHTKISPVRPRALYFSDDVYLGSVQFGDLLELSAVDPKQGAIFYSLKQKQSESPQIARDDANCLSCHHSRRTRDVPGYLVRSVYTTLSGRPRYELGTTTTDPTSEFRERFGGWYVTGKHGKMRHRGNAIVADEGPEELDVESAANLDELDERVDPTRYLTPHSDLVAIMVLEHQSQLHNRITLASYQGRRAKHYDKTWNEILDRPVGHISDVSERRIASAGDELVEYLLFSGEFGLTSPIVGTSDFAKEFPLRGPRDSRGRSLREFDLQQRLFKYPCSYLIYSDSFAALPSNIRQYVNDRLREVLTGEDKSPAFAHLSDTDRQAILEILTDTLPGFGEVPGTGG